MTKTYVVETCTFHGPTKQRRWHLVHTDCTRSECQAYVHHTIATMYANWRPDRAARLFRIRGVRSGK